MLMYLPIWLMRVFILLAILGPIAALLILLITLRKFKKLHN
jgi:hypothetical protein